MAACLCAPASAQTSGQPGWYAGISLGSATADFTTQVTEVAGAAAYSISSDDKSGYGKLYGGYQLMPWFALEAGISNLGSYSTTRTVTAPTSGSLTAKVETIGIYVDAILMARTQTGFTPFARFGTVSANTHIEYFTTGAVTLQPGFDAVHDQSDFFLKLGIGVDYEFNRTLSARLELERMGAGRKSKSSPDQDVDVYRSVTAFSVGLTYRF